MTPRPHGDGRNGGPNRVLSDTSRRDIERQKTGPWCCVCGFSIDPFIIAEGWDTRPVCGPLDRPERRTA